MVNFHVNRFFEGLKYLPMHSFSKSWGSMERLSIIMAIRPSGSGDYAPQFRAVAESVPS